VIPGVPDFGFGPAPAPGRPDALLPGLLRLTAPNPGLMTGPGTNTYVVGRGDLAVVDPGPDDATHRAALLAAAGVRGTIRWVLVTHTHADHAPGAAALAAATGARVIGFGPADRFAPDERVGDGWTLRVGGDHTLEAVHTPGHASDHLCWLIRQPAVLLTGDHVMHGSTVVIRPPDGDVTTYRVSLARVRDADPPVAVLAPGHGRLMGHVAEEIDALLAHRQARHETVADALERAGRATPDELLPVVYADVTEAQLPVARYSLWAHLRALGAEQRAAPVGVTAGSDTIESAWRWLQST
jgi:glyoxylase-like metal-dependent hydrolase (beta-lactamase superfamily II)